MASPFLSGEVAVKGGDQQRLAEAARTDQEEELAAAVGHAVDVLGLIYIDEMAGNNLPEGLYAYGI